MMIPPVAVPFGFLRLAAGMLGFPRGAGGRDFAADLAAATAARAATLHPSGRAALSALLRDAAAPGRDEVLLPAYTCWTVPASAVRAGLRVRVADVDPVTLDFDRAGLEAAPTGRLAAVVAAHLFARTCDVAGVAASFEARDRSVRVVEDAAQAWPSGNPAPSWPVVLSFGRGKPLPLGGGGAVLHHDSCAPRSHGAPPHGGGWRGALALLAASLIGRPVFFGTLERIPRLGIGATVYDPGFDAASPPRAWRDRLGARLIASLPELAAERTRNAVRLLERAPILGKGWRWTSAARAEGPLRLPVLAPSRSARDAAIRELRASGVAASPMYPGTIAEIAELRPHLVNPEEPLPGARFLADRLLTLPTYPGLDPGDLARIGDSLERAVTASTAP